MTSIFAAPLVQLAAGEVSSGVSAASCDVQVLTGCLWLTVEGDARDYWLCAGDSLRIPPGCLVVAEAHRQPGSFSVVPCVRHTLQPQLYSAIKRGEHYARSDN